MLRGLPTLLGCALVVLSALPVWGADPTPDEVPLGDLLQIVVLPREVVAVAATGGERTAKLNLGERVLWTGARGRVGVVLTDERVLAVATGSGSWQESRYLRGERRPQSADLGDRVALIITSRRALGFLGSTGNLVEYSLGPNEALLQSRVGDNVAVVVTDRNALGLSPVAGGFFSFSLHARERVRSLDTGANLATVRTNRRILTFRAPTGTWSERKLDLDQG